MKQELLDKARTALNELEFNLFSMMFPQSGVVFLKGRFGAAKSAILRSVAQKLDMVFVDLRLPTMDETDLGVYPVVDKDRKSGNPVLDHAIPKWAQLTAENPGVNYMIVFEELNRAELAQRNAALGLLNERIIGTNFVFGPNVYMAATGNLGQDDSTDVNEFDAALKSRLITIHWDLSPSDWLKYFAQDNIHPDIVRYIEQHPTDSYPEGKEQGRDKDVITCYRTWTFLSNAIIALFGKKSGIDDYSRWLLKNGSNYIGSRTVKLNQFLMDTKRLKLEDVLSGQTKKWNVNRENRAEILEEVVAIELEKIPYKQVQNLVDFLKTFQGDDSDVLAGKIFAWITKPGNTEKKDLLKHKNYRLIMDTFKTEILHIRKTHTSSAK